MLSAYSNSDPKSAQHVHLPHLQFRPPDPATSGKLGYNRAGRIVDQLEATGILGGFEGSKARRVMIPNEAALHAHLNNGVAAGPGVGGF